MNESEKPPRRLIQGGSLFKTFRQPPRYFAHRLWRSLRFAFAWNVVGLAAEIRLLRRASFVSLIVIPLVASSTVLWYRILDPRQEKLLPWNLAALFTAAVCVLFAELIYQLFAPLPVRGTSEAQFVERRKKLYRDQPLEETLARARELLNAHDETADEIHSEKIEVERLRDRLRSAKSDETRQRILRGELSSRLQALLELMELTIEKEDLEETVKSELERRANLQQQDLVRLQNVATVTRAAGIEYRSLCRLRGFASFASLALYATAGYMVLGVTLRQLDLIWRDAGWRNPSDALRWILELSWWQ